MLCKPYYMTDIIEIFNAIQLQQYKLVENSTKKTFERGQYNFNRLGAALRYLIKYF